MIKARIGNRLIVPCTQEIMAWCRDNLVMDNPDYYKKERLGKWTGNTPQSIYLFEKIGEELWLPFGCFKNFAKAFPDTAFKPEFSDFRRVSYDSGINLYHYQEKAVNAALKAKNGVLVMPCGSGKTQTALEIVSRLGGRTLWLTHTTDLLTQSMNRAKAVLNTSASYGKITAGKVDLGSGITFATVQTLSKLDLSKYKDYWDVIINDEVHHAAGSPTKVTQFYKVLSSLSARYKIGLTATPKRADGLEKSMFALLGGIMCEITREEVKETTCPIKIEFCQTGYTPEYNAVLMGDGTLNYAALVNDLITNEKRFECVIDKLKEISGQSVIILANRVDYISRLSEEYNKVIGRSVCLSTLGQSKAAKRAREEALTALNNGEIDAIFATYQLAKEGLDVPDLRYIVLATPEKDSSTVIQSVGRVGRKAPGKEYGTVIDFVDDFGMYLGWAKKRKGYYKKLGAEYPDL